MNRSLQEEIQLAEAEQAMFGIDHAEIAGQWMRDEGISSILAEGGLAPRNARQDFPAACCSATPSSRPTSW